MYHFDKPIKHIVRQAKELAKAVETDRLLSSQTRSINHPIYFGQIAQPIGNLKITSGVNNNFGPAYIHITVEPFGHNDTTTIAADGHTTEDIASAIGFACGMDRQRFIDANR